MHDCSLPPLAISLFGPFEARVNGEPLPRLRSRKGQWLLALLTLRAGHDVERAWLVGTLWPESDESAAFANLRSSLKDLRHALGPQAGRLRSPTPHLLSLDLTGAAADVVQFDLAIAAGDPPSLERAIALYRAPLLEGCAEPWAFEERQVREQAFLAACETLASHAVEAGDPGTAARHLRRAVGADPLRESAQRALMQVLAAGGHAAAALQVYRELRLLLQRELNAEPDPATRALFEQIQAEARRRAAIPYGSAPPSPAHRAPAARQLLLEVPRSSGLILPLSRAAGFRPADDAPRRNGHDTGRSPGDEPPESAPPGSREAREGREDEQEPAGGVVPLASPSYVVRPVDETFQAAIARRDSIVLVKGARQTGKSSLLARGFQQAREAGCQVVLTDLRMLNASELETAERFLLALAQSLAAELDLDVWPQEVWKADAGPNLNFDLYLRRQVFGTIPGPIVWGLDEVDRLFTCDFGGDVFGLFRCWHNRRHLNPASPWSRLTLVMAYATEVHLFVTDPNQSPFNVGTRLELGDLTLEQVADLNDRYHSPLRDPSEVARFYRLVGGQPYLAQRGLAEMKRGGIDIDAFEAQAHREGGIFADHLRRMRRLLLQSPELCDAVREVLAGRPCALAESFYRLRTAGVLTGESAREAAPRCHVYARYLEEYLR